jgi:hypothetical protein
MLNKLVAFLAFYWAACGMAAGADLVEIQQTGSGCLLINLRPDAE